MKDLVHQKKTTNITALQRLRKKITDSIGSNLGKDLAPIDLKNLHHIFRAEEINAVRLKAFQDINEIDWKQIIKEIAFTEISNLLGPDLCIQKKINVSIQMPNDSTSILAAHTDCNSGESPFQYNLWIPMTNAFGTNSMFIFNENTTLSYYKNINNADYKKPTPTAENFVNIEFGEYLLFPPSLIHGNVLNETSSTRVSLNVRVKSLFAPDLTDGPPDRKYGSFYEAWNKSHHFIWNKQIYDCMKR